MRTEILSITLILFLPFFAQAQSLTLTDPSLVADLQGMDSTHIQRLLKDKEMIMTGTGWDRLTWWPNTPFAPALRKQLAGTISNLGLEGLYLIPRPSNLDNEQILLKLYSHLQNLGSLKGLQYWSVSKNNWDTLIVDSYRVNLKGSRTPLGPLNPTLREPTSSLLTYQKDNKLGEGYYQFEYTNKADEIQLVTRNLDSLNWGFIPIVSPGDFVLVLSVKIYPTSILLHTLTAARTMEFFGLERSKDESFINRMKAFARWFTQGLAL